MGGLTSRRSAGVPARDNAACSSACGGGPLTSQTEDDEVQPIVAPHVAGETNPWRIAAELRRLVAERNRCDEAGWRPTVLSSLLLWRNAQLAAFDRAVRSTRCARVHDARELDLASRAIRS